MATEGNKISLAVLAGDGIGPEITAATVRVLKAAAARGGLGLALTPYPIGWKERFFLIRQNRAFRRDHGPHAGRHE
jgi:isocitrate dehydrogenase